MLSSPPSSRPLVSFEVASTAASLIIVGLTLGALWCLCLGCIHITEKMTETKPRERIVMATVVSPKIV